MKDFYKHRALRLYSKQEIAKYYGITLFQLQERHYFCYYRKHFLSKAVGHYR
jgi:hypothetical protein